MSSLERRLMDCHSTIAAAPSAFSVSASIQNLTASTFHNQVTLSERHRFGLARTVYARICYFFEKAQGKSQTDALVGNLKNAFNRLGFRPATLGKTVEAICLRDMKSFSGQGHLFFEDMYAAARTGLDTMKALKHKPSEEFRIQSHEILRGGFAVDSDHGYLPGLFHQAIVWFAQTAELLNLPMQDELAEVAVKAVCNNGQNFIRGGLSVDEAEIARTREWMLSSLALIIGEERAGTISARLMDDIIHAERNNKPVRRIFGP